MIRIQNLLVAGSVSRLSKPSDEDSKKDIQVKAMGAFYLSKTFGWKFGKPSVSNGEAFLLFVSNFQSILHDDPMKAREHNQGKMEILRKCYGNFCSDRLEPEKNGVRLKVVRLFQQILRLIPASICISTSSTENVWLNGKHNNLQYRLCGKRPDSVPHILGGCSALAHSKYLERHNTALEVLYFDLKLID